MTLSNLLSAVLVTIVLTGVRPFLANAATSVDAIRVGCPINYNGGYVQTRSGEVYFNFAKHRSEAELQIFEQILSNPAQVKPELLPQLKQWLAGVESFLGLDQQMMDSQRLKSLVTAGIVKWIGVEYSPNELGSVDGRGRNDVQRAEVIRIALERSGADQDMIKKMILLFSGSPGRNVWFSEPTVRSKAVLVPLDSDELKARALKLLDEIDSNKKILSFFAEKRYPDSTPTVNTLLSKLAEIDRTNAEPTDAEIERNVAMLNDGDMKSFAINIFHQQRDFSRLQKERNSFAAQTILRQIGTGWVSFGESHKEIQSKIVESCKSD